MKNLNEIKQQLIEAQQEGMINFTNYIVDDPILSFIYDDFELLVQRDGEPLTVEANKIVSNILGELNTFQNVIDELWNEIDKKVEDGEYDDEHEMLEDEECVDDLVNCFYASFNDIYTFSDVIEMLENEFAEQ